MEVHHAKGVPNQALQGVGLAGQCIHQSRQLEEIIRVKLPRRPLQLHRRVVYPLLALKYPSSQPLARCLIFIVEALLRII